MEIERIWGLGLGGFTKLQSEQRARLFAWYRVASNPGKAKAGRPKSKAVKVGSESAADFWGL